MSPLMAYSTHLAILGRASETLPPIDPSLIGVETGVPYAGKINSVTMAITAIATVVVGVRYVNVPSSSSSFFYLVDPSKKIEKELIHGKGVITDTLCTYRLCRVYIRSVVVKNLAWDDYLIVLAMVSSRPRGICATRLANDLPQEKEFPPI